MKSEAAIPISKETLETFPGLYLLEAFLCFSHEMCVGRWEGVQMKVSLFGFLKSFEKNGYQPNDFQKLVEWQEIGVWNTAKNDLHLPFGLFANISRRVFVRWPGPWALLMRSFWTLGPLRLWRRGLHSSTTATAGRAGGRTVPPFPAEQSPQNSPQWAKGQIFNFFLVY